MHKHRSRKDLLIKWKGANGRKEGSKQVKAMGRENDHTLGNAIMRPIVL